MKKKINWWVIIAIIVIGVPVGYVGMGLVQKQNPEPVPDTHILTIACDEFIFGSDGDSKSFEIESNVEWTVVVDEEQDWLTVDCNSGEGDETVTLAVTENAETSERFASVRVIWTDDEEKEHEEIIDVVQEGKTASAFNADPSIVSFPRQGDTKTITVSCNTDWEVTVFGGNGWRTVDCADGSGNKTITLKAKENSASNGRSAKLKFRWRDDRGEPQELEVPIEQDGGTPTLYVRVPSSVSFADNGGSKNVSVNSNTDWKITTSGGDGWLTVTPMSGNDNKSITLMASENTSTTRRTATLKFAWTDAQGVDRDASLTVSQSGYVPPTYSLRVSQQNVSFGANGGIKSVPVRSNTNWVVTTTGGDGWLTVDPVSGNGNKNITLKATRNTNNISRTADMKIEWTDGQGVTKSEMVKVKQEDAATISLMVTPSDVLFNSNAGSKSVSVKSNADWEVTVAGGDGWLSVNRTSGNGNKNITIKATENTSESRRQATIALSWKDNQENTQTSTISVTQEGRMAPPIPGILTIDEAQSIIASGQRSNKVSEGCVIVVNGKTMDYQAFRNGVKLKTYSHVNVNDVKCDAQGNASVIRVSATVEQEQ